MTPYNSKTDLELLSDAAARFLSHDFNGNVYQFIGERLNELVGESLVIINEYDLEQHATFVRAFTGPAAWCDQAVQLLVQYPLELSFFEGISSQMTVGKLSRVEGGLFDLVAGGITKALCEEVERQLGICAIFAIPLITRGAFIGVVIIFSRETQLPGNVQIIETFTSLAAMALHNLNIENERERLLKQLEEERTLWKTTVESMPDPVTVCDPKGIATYMNPIYSQLIQRTIDPSLNLEEHQAYYRIYHPDGSPFESKDLPLQRAAFNDEIVTESELVQRLPDGEERNIVFNAAPLHDKAGQILGAVAVGRDITGQRKAENALRKALDELEIRVEERTHDLQLANQELSQQIVSRRQAESQVHLQSAALEAAASGIVITDRRANIVWCNPAFTRITNYSRDELIGQNPRILRSGLHDRAYYNNMWQTILSGKVWYGETINRHKDGSLYTVEGSITPVLDEKGEITHFISIKQDVTEKKRALELIRQHAARAETLARVAARLTTQLDLNAVMQIICDETSIALKTPFVTIALYNLTQDGFHIACGSGFSTATLENLPLMPKDYYDRLFQSDGSPIIIEDVQSRDDLTFSDLYRKENIGTVVSAMMRHEDKIVGALNILSQAEVCQFDQHELAMLQGLADQAALAITNAGLYSDLENALAKEQSMRRQLVDSEKHNALSRMVASVAHEINNPLQTIKNCLYLTEQEVQEGPAVEYLNMATTETRRISNLVSQLREIYRPNKLEPPKRLSLGKLLDEVHALLLPHLLYNQVAWSLKKPALDLVINVVPDQIKQVFLNIALNAIEAMQPAGGSLVVTILAVDMPPGGNKDLPVKATGHVTISFKDSGPGITEENLNKIFDPFFTTKETGTGLGLPICYDIIKRFNGGITVESQVGHGATFTICLPLA